MKIYQCEVCGLHYNTEELRDKCSAHCTMYSACSLEVMQHSLKHLSYPEHKHAS